MTTNTRGFIETVLTAAKPRSVSKGSGRGRAALMASDSFASTSV